MTHTPDVRAIVAEAREYLAVSGDRDDKFHISPNNMAALIAAGAEIRVINTQQSGRGHVTQVYFENITFIAVTDMEVNWPAFALRC